jgi:predicted dehydrogenase
MATGSPIRLGLIGAGIFARDAHLPSLKALADTFEIAAVYSRTQSTAESFARLLPKPPQVYTDLAAMLANPNIDAVNVLLPIEQLAGAVEQSLAAGKHVISEKPIAPDVETGRKLLTGYTGRTDQVWMVAENWRYEGAFLQASEVIQHGEIGQPLVFHWALHIPFMPEGKYYQTEWRRSGTFPGGLLMDGGVHHVAVIRLVLGEIASVSAEITQMRPDLPPADTLSAALRLDSGVIGHYTVNYTANAAFQTYLSVVGTKGSLRVSRDQVEVSVGHSTRSTDFGYSDGVRAELSAFAAAINDGAPHRNSPQAALQDVAVVEAILNSAASGSRVTPERFI